MKKFVNISLSLLILVSVFWVTGNEVSANTILSDIPAGHPVEEQVEFLVNKEIISGYPDGTFRPNNSVTRREAAIVIAKAFNLNGNQRKTSFSDVASSDYASGYIQSAHEAGFISGYGNDTYKPDRYMTRGEMSYLLSKAFNFSASKNYYFIDVNPFSHYYDVINRLANNGVTIGYTDDTFRPDKIVTRGEFAIFTSRSLESSFRIMKEQTNPEKRIIKADWLNVRKGPGTSYDSAGLIKEGTLVSSYFKTGNWAYIKAPGYEGFVYATYLGVPVSALSGKVITVDPGHGDTDPGATANGLVEKEVVLSVGKKLRTYLERAGVKVVMTRSDDSYPSLSDRVGIAEKSNSDSFISIHANKFHSDAAHGTETFYNYYSPQGAEAKKLATYIQNRLYKAIDTSNRGVKHGNFQVIRDNYVPGVLVELGFLSNPNDARKLASNAYREKAAEAIYLGILDYYKNK
ncbi:N-acetylmuramoyl-L-alanine amidase [Pseudalkalibacillus berkeleyi]|uniref:N-acetylmuramoyl-L-alanine amidase n=1 Tax=Pseudalkalibacillus berkeleyi TaxID=1069813 RepID=A0ABS9H1A9_9BACL|nr:N-acetylmuramoyl-L-alanine amidase [Pseudalkalibacillus berkeleyi]MCF6138784.1 N-acetylmuramoyl-L-alanine amidase [Pseudalkalibacillus berkeleyi]